MDFYTSQGAGKESHCPVTCYEDTNPKKHQLNPLQRQLLLFPVLLDQVFPGPTAN